MRTVRGEGGLAAESARVAFELKHRQPGIGTPRTEVRHWPSYSRRLSRDVKLHRVINRADDQYYKLITDYVTGEVIYRAAEKLSEHLGHGDDKANKSSKL